MSSTAVGLTLGQAPGQPDAMPPSRDQALVPAAPTAVAAAARLLCVSLHDVSPAAATALPKMVDLCRSAGVERFSLLVVPDWHGSSPLDRDPATADAIRRLAEEGCEIILHGLRHHADTQIPRGFWAWVKGTWFASGEGEFYGLDRDEARRRLDEGRAMFERAGLPSPRGFIAPAWLAGDGARQALTQSGLRYHEDTLRLYDLPATRSYFSPVIGFGPRRVWEREALLLYARLMAGALRFARVVRVALHPVDVADRRTARSAARLLQRQLRRRRPVTYSEALDLLAA
jgi:predicted deacetylase